MLRLERLQIAGFKSFYDRTEARFPDGITAVVGPNGCGKSNIGDALNWVLGEQSPRNLRGRQMMDVIFNGSERRKPRGMAEVSLHLADVLTGAAADRAPTVVTRRLFRSGESEYLLNGKKCRLKDIQDLLLAEHVGAKTYATIEQGRIDQILNAKPKERRQIFEDAAGVSGFKHKRRLAELKLEATHANLLRVHDIVSEVGRQINSLKRQAAKARRYQRLREEHRARERVLFGARSAALEARLGELREDEAAARDAEVAAAAELAAGEAALGAERDALDERERDHRRAAEELHRLELEIDRSEAHIRNARERVDDSERSAQRCEEEAGALRTRLEELRAAGRAQEEIVREARERVDRLGRELDARQAAAADAAGRRDAIRQTLDSGRRELFESMNTTAEQRNRRRAIEDGIRRIAAERERLERERTAAEEELLRSRAAVSALSDEIEAHARSLAGLRAEAGNAERASEAARAGLEDRREHRSAAREGVQSAEARLATLEDVGTRFAGFSDGVRMLLTSGTSAGLKTHGVIADFVEARQDVEGVAETYLQSLLPAVILEDGRDAERAAEMLRAGDAGRATFLCRDAPAGAVAVGTAPNGSPAIPDAVLADPRVRGRLRDRLRLHTAMNGVVQDRIGDAVLVDRLATALELHRAHPGVDYLTADGEIVYASGLVSAGGRGGGDRGLLAHNRKMHDARTELERARDALAAIDADVERRRLEADELQSRVEEVRARVEESARHEVELRVRHERTREDVERLSQRAGFLRSELDGALDEGRRLDRELAEVVRSVEAAESSHRDVESKVDVESGRLLRIEDDLREASESAAETRAALAGQREGLEAAVRERQRLDEAGAEVEARSHVLLREAEEARERARQAEASIESTGERLAAQLADRERMAEERRRSDEEIVDRRESVARREATLREHRVRQESLRERARAAELARSKAESDLAHIDDLARREIGMTAQEAARLSAEELSSPELDLEQLERDVDDLRERIERIGPVNMMAIEEFSELEERHAFLTSQKDDLERSMDSLRETIRKINRQSRERFREAFEAIRANYQEIFRVLFNGGRADLRLEDDEDDILECGIEILAQPPGKRLGSVQLMSGGEKAMSAIALLFAIFRYQPSPFCLLDEVDAPLDDVNVGRFTRLLREYASQTQFILITHNKVSMESANLLYGVTMEEPGVSRLVSLEVH